jgi:hypothetical protein
MRHLGFFAFLIALVVSPLGVWLCGIGASRAGDWTVWLWRLGQLVSWLGVVVLVMSLPFTLIALHGILREWRK